MAKWYRLREWLEGLGEDRVVVDFHQLTEILGDEVPASASRHRHVFWSNSRSHAHARHWLDAGYRTRLGGLPPDQVEFVSTGVNERAGESDDDRRAESLALPEVGQQSDEEATLLLVGCVKTKQDTPATAKELYRSELFRRRRAYADACGVPWAILSAEHGLVWPDETLEPYDRYLEEQPVAYRHEWGRRVVARLEADLGSVAGHVVAVHASAAYVEPIRARLEARGAVVVWPFAGAGIGQHLNWYAHAGTAGSATATSSAESAPSTPPETVTGPRAGGNLAWRLTELFHRGELDLSDRTESPSPGWQSMPEVLACEALREVGVVEAEIRRFCTFLMAMDRARDADLLWQRGAALLQRQPWVFDPARIVASSLTELADALRGGGVSQRHGPDVAAWRLIAESLLDADATPAVHRAVEHGQGEADALLLEVATETPGGSHRFPLLRGPKIAPVWVRILAYPGGAEIAGLERLAVGVDVQVRKVSEYLGVADTAGRPLAEIREPLQQLWHEEVRRAGAAGPWQLANTPAALDPALWFYGKWGCTRCEQAGDRNPISPLCDVCRFDELR